VKITDGNQSNFLNANKEMRGNIFKNLLNAKRTLAPSHPAHGHIDKAAAELGGVVDNTPDEMSVRDRSEDASNDPGNLTSPGTITMNVNAREAGARQATGSSDVATRSAGRAQDLSKRAEPLYHKDRHGVWQVYRVQKEDGASKTRRDLLVKILYKSAAAMKDSAAKSKLEKFTMSFDSIADSEIAKMSEEQWAGVEQIAMGNIPTSEIQFIGGGGNRKTWEDRHF
jgi:hypothetical protein